jgi:hypothetical protein
MVKLNFDKPTKETKGFANNNSKLLTPRHHKTKEAN